MRGHSEKFGRGNNSHDGPIIELLVTLVAKWAERRPILSEVIVFGSWVRGDHTFETPLELAVRYGDPFVEDAFDDWIEQLRTDFEDLRCILPVSVQIAMPNDAEAWRFIQFGTQRGELAQGKVRCFLTMPHHSSSETAQPRQSTPHGTVRGASDREFWRDLVSSLRFVSSRGLQGIGYGKSTSAARD